MNNKRADKSHRNKKVCNISLTGIDKDKMILIDNKIYSPINKCSKAKPNTEINDDNKNKSILTMSLKMNRYFSSDGYDNNLTLEDISPLNYYAPSKYEKCTKPRLEKTCKSKICGSCKNNSTKIKYKSHKAQLQVSIKSKKSVVDLHKVKSEENMYDGNESSDCSNSKFRHNYCAVCAEKETLSSRSDLLLHFLNQMRNIVSTKEMKFDSLKMICERLILDRKNSELLMLMDLIIRFQVSKVKEIIFQDLLSKKIIPVNFTRVFLKQYEFLKSLSVVYSDILKDYESNFLFLYDLSFDLINRAHFKIHLYDDCKEIQDLIDVGHFNIKEELIFDIKSSDKEKERIRIIFSDMKSDFETTTKWKNVQKNTEKVIKNSFEVGKSLLKYFNSHCSVIEQDNSPDTNKKCVDVCHGDAENYIKSLKELATACGAALPSSDLPSKSLINHSCSLIECSSRCPNSACYDFEVSSLANRYYCPRRMSSHVSSLAMKMNCQKIYKSLANVKPPSLSRSSSSTNSNGYNSCVSTSSFEDSSDEDDVDRETAKILYSFKHDQNTCDSLSSNLHDNSVNEETKPPTPVSFNGDEECESRFDDSLEDGHKRFMFQEKDHSWINDELNHEDIDKFNKLYEKYLSENEHLLLDNPSSSAMTHMSVPDCIKSLQSAESLHSLLSSIMDKCKRGLNMHDSRPRRCHSKSNELQELDSAEHLYFSNSTSTSCPKPSTQFPLDSGLGCSSFPDDAFPLDPSLLGLKDDDFDMDFEELNRTLSPSSTIEDNLKEFEKYLCTPGTSGIGLGTERAHPHLHALVKTCRIYCNQLYKRVPSSDSLPDLCRLPDTATSNTTATNPMTIMSTAKTSKQTTIVIEQISDDESCGAPDDSSTSGVRGSGDAMNTDIDPNQDNCSSTTNTMRGDGPVINTNINGISSGHHLSSSDTGSSSSTTGTENPASSISKVCNCCKCEMFGEQNYFGQARSATNVVEKLRMKLQKRKQQCQLKSHSKKLPQCNGLVSGCGGVSSVHNISCTANDNHNTQCNTSHINTNNNNSNCSSIYQNSPNCNGTLEDVDVLVKYINGDVDSVTGTVSGTGETPVPPSPDLVVSSATSVAATATSRKSKLKAHNKSTTELTQKSQVTLQKPPTKTTSTEDKSSSVLSQPGQPVTPVGAGPRSTNKKHSVGAGKSSISVVNSHFPTSSSNCVDISATKSAKSANSDLSAETIKQSTKPVLKDKSTNKEYNSSKPSDSLPVGPFAGDMAYHYVDDENDYYDPVVEDFKRFCDKVLVVPNHRKKLPIDPTLLISELEKCQQENQKSSTAVFK